MLWDLIRDFFVIHLFGGFDSQGDFFSASLGCDYNGELVSTGDVFYKLGGNGLMDVSEPLYYSIGDYLSTLATLITISIVFVLCCFFVYKIIRLVGGLISR